MPMLSDYAQKRKIDYFLKPIAKDAKILEIGSGEGWVGSFLKSDGWNAYIGLDIEGPADVVGDIKDWKKIGLKPNSFDVIIAFELIEHVDCVQECYDLLREGVKLMLTSPVPHFDWFLKILENIGLNQKRTSPHSNLVYFQKIPLFKPEKLKTVAGLSQWGIFTK